MNPYEQEANLLVSEAKKKLTRGFFGILFGFTPKSDEAAECYHRAGNLFKACQNWVKAGEVFVNAANLCLQTQNIPDAAYSYANAALCYKKFDEEQAIKCYEKTIEIYTGLGKFTTAAKYHVFIAEIHENQPGNLEAAIKHYEQAADYYLTEESTSLANKYLLKVAEYSALCENYEKSINIYEKVANSTMGNTLLRYSTKEYFFRATLCHLLVDKLNAAIALEKYNSIFPALSDSREYKFLEKIFKCIEDEDEDGFALTVKEFDSVSKLNEWVTAILLKIKKSIANVPDMK